MNLYPHEIEFQRVRDAAPALLEVARKWLAYDNCDESDFSSAGPMLLYAEAINATRDVIASLDTSNEEGGQ